MSEANGTMRRKPQLSESIEKLDTMIDDLSVAIPGAVGESVREAMGPAFVAAVREAVKQAVAEALREAGAGVTAPQAPPPPSPAPAVPPKPSPWAKVKAALGRLRRGVARTVAPTLGRLAIGWAVAKLIGSATIRSRAVALATAASGVAAGLLGLALGPIGASALLALLTGAIAATAAWAAPTVRLLTAFRDD